MARIEGRFLRCRGRQGVASVWQMPVALISTRTRRPLAHRDQARRFQAASLASMRQRRVVFICPSPSRLRFLRFVNPERRYAFFVRVKNATCKKTPDKYSDVVPQALHADAGRQGWRFQTSRFLIGGVGGSESEVAGLRRKTISSLRRAKCAASRRGKPLTGRSL